jgi:GNAT superfamily N-acetyltransferase
VTIARTPDDRPPGYPVDAEQHLRLRDGRSVFVRPVVPQDAPALAEAFRTADAETLRRRFLGGAPNPTAALLDRLTTVDYDRRFALVAADERSGDGVAIARYEGEPGARIADAAVVVRPGWRRVGLATALVELLARAALERGVVEFSATYLAQNQPVSRLLALADGGGRSRIEQGIAEAAVALDRARNEAAPTDRE